MVGAHNNDRNVIRFDLAMRTMHVGYCIITPSKAFRFAVCIHRNLIVENANQI